MNYAGTLEDQDSTVSIRGRKLLNLLFENDVNVLTGTLLKYKDVIQRLNFSFTKFEMEIGDEMTKLKTT